MKKRSKTPSKSSLAPTKIRKPGKPPQQAMPIAPVLPMDVPVRTNGTLTASEPSDVHQSSPRMACEGARIAHGGEAAAMPRLTSLPRSWPAAPSRSNVFSVWLAVLALLLATVVVACRAIGVELTPG